MMVRWIFNFRPEDAISAHELRARIGQHKGMFTEQKTGHVERMEERAWSSKCRTFQVSGSFPKG